VSTPLSPFGPHAAMLKMMPVPAYPQRATLLVHGSIILPSGSVKEIWVAATNPLLVDMPIRKSPMIQQRPAGGEVDTDIGVVNLNEEAVAFKSYRPEIDEKDRLQIDGEGDYDIIKVENDGSLSYTRLRVLRRD
jgi:hypothetical protein